MDDNHGDSSAEASAEEDTKDTEGCSLALEAEQGKDQGEVSRRQESAVRIREIHPPERRLPAGKLPCRRTRNL